MVVIEMPDGRIQDYHLRAARDGLRVEPAARSYDLMVMIREARWRIVGARSHAAKRLLKVAGLPNDVEMLPPRIPWRTSLASASATVTATAHASHI
jgi:hypothetical protein